MYRYIVYELPLHRSFTYSYLHKHAGAPDPATSLTFQEIASLSEDRTQVAVNVSWDSPENVQEFVLQIQSTNYNNTIRSLENSVTVLLPYGSYSATLCTINRCGETCQDHPNSFSTGPQPTVTPNADSCIYWASTYPGIKWYS